MQENHYKILAFRIIKINCIIDILPGPITISTEDTLSFRKPSDPSKKMGLLKVETQLTSDDTDEFKVEIISETIFQFDSIPDDFDKEMRNKCYPMAKERIHTAIKEITATMGIKPLDLTSAQ